MGSGRLLEQGPTSTPVPQTQLAAHELEVGAHALARLEDVNLTGLTDKDLLQWDASTKQFIRVPDHRPWMVNIPAPAITPRAQTNWSTYASSSVIGGGTLDSSGAQNAEIAWDEVLSAGTWLIELLHRQNVNRGIYTVQLDGVTVGTIDGYAGADVVNKRDTIAGIAVATTKLYRLRLLMATRNALNTTGFFGSLQHVGLRRTA